METQQIALVFVCKGRLAHIRESLPLAVRQEPDEIILVDYECPDGAGDWVRSHYPEVKVVEATDPKGFSLARGRNIGAENAASRFILFIDADIRIGPGFVSWLRANIEQGCFYTSLASELHVKKGTFCCAKRDFDAVGGYDEAFRLWGNEDTDLYARLLYRNTKLRDSLSDFLTPIEHDDSLRTEYYSVKSKSRSNSATRLYLALKHHLLNSGIELNLAEREHIFKEITDQHDSYTSNGEIYIVLDDINSENSKFIISIRRMRRFLFFGRKTSFVKINQRRFTRLRLLHAGDFLKSRTESRTFP